VGAFLASLNSRGIAGLNVTVPHKEQSATLIDHIDSAAAAAGSVNTVVCDNGVLTGYSTDGYGLQTAIREDFGIDIRGRRAVFLGTGGAARA